jgi:hypothetical protein
VKNITNNSRHQQTTAFALHQMTSGTASFAEQRQKNIKYPKQFYFSEAKSINCRS